ncbi:MAG: Uncharacterized MFS-type transporter, partial [uncultured Nocardioidaceae bacterium]
DLEGPAARRTDGRDAAARVPRLPAALHRRQRLLPRQHGRLRRGAVPDLPAHRLQPDGRAHRRRGARAARRLRAVRRRAGRPRRPATAARDHGPGPAGADGRVRLERLPLGPAGLGDLRGGGVLRRGERAAAALPRGAGATHRAARPDRGRQRPEQLRHAVRRAAGAADRRPAGGVRRHRLVLRRGDGGVRRRHRTVRGDAALPARRRDHAAEPARHPRGADLRAAAPRPARHLPRRHRRDDAGDPGGALPRPGRGGLREAAAPRAALLRRDRGRAGRDAAQRLDLPRAPPRPRDRPRGRDVRRLHRARGDDAVVLARLRVLRPGGRGRHGVRGLPQHGLEPDHPGHDARAPGGDRDAVLLRGPDGGRGARRVRRGRVVGARVDRQRRRRLRRRSAPHRGSTPGLLVVRRPHRRARGRRARAPGGRHPL